MEMEPGNRSGKSKVIQHTDRPSIAYESTAPDVSFRKISSQ